MLSSNDNLVPINGKINGNSRAILSFIMYG